MKLYLGSLVMAFTALAGCRTADSSHVKIYGGTEIAQTSRPSVVSLSNHLGKCTGVFVSPTTMLTAAHCIPSSSSDSVDTSYMQDGRPLLTPEGYGRGERSSKIFHDGIYGEAVIRATVTRPIQWRDFAVVVFPVAMNNRVSPIRINTRPQVGEAVELVGFGFNNPGSATTRPSGAGVLREGRSRIESRAADGTITLPEINAQPLEGDSGGPLFVGTQVIGIASYIYRDLDNKPIGSVYVDLSHPEVISLMRRAVAGGAVIPGVEPADPAQDDSTSTDGLTDPAGPALDAELSEGQVEQLARLASVMKSDLAQLLRVEGVSAQATAEVTAAWSRFLKLEDLAQKKIRKKSEVRTLQELYAPRSQPVSRSAFDRSATFLQIEQALRDGGR